MQPQGIGHTKVLRPGMASFGASRRRPRGGGGGVGGSGLGQGRACEGGPGRRMTGTFPESPPTPHWRGVAEPSYARDSLTAGSPPGKVVCEEPNSRMHHFVGCLEWKGKKYPLDSGNILLRGCKIRNTDTCYGLVIYAGTATPGTLGRAPSRSGVGG